MVLALAPGLALHSGLSCNAFATRHCAHTLQVVAPKRAALAEANKRLDGANKKLSGIRAKVKELQDRVAALEESLMRATEDKNNAVAQVGRRLGAEGRSRAGALPNGTNGMPATLLHSGRMLPKPPLVPIPTPPRAGGAHSQQGSAGTAPHYRASGRVHALDGEHSNDGCHGGQPGRRCASVGLFCQLCRCGAGQEWESGLPRCGGAECAAGWSCGCAPPTHLNQSFAPPPRSLFGSIPC